MSFVKHSPKKHLGQNFLVDQRIQQKIIQACELKPDDVVVEIGPGQGVLSRLIAPHVKKLISVETDRDLIGPLQTSLPASVEIVHADFLKWHMLSNVKIIGNIPYYISTPIIEKLIKDRANIQEAFLTVQLEFGQRLAASAGGKDYGSLSCFAQYYADIKVLFKIKNTCFNPAPKVDSCFLRMSFRPAPETASDEEFLFELIETAFQQRRKTLVNALKGLVAKVKLEEILGELGIDFKARPGGVNFVKLHQALQSAYVIINFIMEKRIFYHDTDAGGIVYYGQYLCYLEEARTEFLEQRGLSVEEFKDRGFFYVVRQCNVTYRSPARYGDTLICDAKLKTMGASQLVFDQTVHHKKEGRLIIEAEVSLVCLNKDFRPTPIPDDLREKLAR